MTEPPTPPDAAAEPIVETSVRVRYAETDQLGVVYHANYFIWFEIGRVEYLRARGFSYREMEAQDRCHIVVAEASCRYKAPARYDDVVTIRTRVTRRRGPILTFAYEAVRAGDQTLLATGETVHVIVDENFEPRELPEKYQAGMVPERTKK
jgi:acyl-CoA thioester hydrolase